jgi:hypothetical protein
VTRIICNNQYQGILTLSSGANTLDKRSSMTMLLIAAVCKEETGSSTSILRNCLFDDPAQYKKWSAR